MTNNKTTELKFSSVLGCLKTALHRSFCIINFCVIFIMNEENFLIRFIPSKHCFLQFSNKWLQKLNTSKCSCVKLIQPATKRELRFTWAPQPTYGLNDCSVGINATFAQALSLHENELVVIYSEEILLSVRQVFLTPVTADDYEILEISRDSVEMSLLDQTRVVNVKQVVPVWVTKTMHLKLTVDRLEPESQYGRLEPQSELFIENVTKTSGSASFKKVNVVKSVTRPLPYKNYQQKQDSLLDLLSDYLPNNVLNLIRPSQRTNQDRDETGNKQVDNSELLCRIHPFPKSMDRVVCCHGVHDQLTHPFNVFVRKNTLVKEGVWPQDTFVPKLAENHHSVALCRLEAIPVTKSKPSNNKSAEDDKSTDHSNNNPQKLCVIVRLHQIDDSCELFKERTNVSCVYVTKFLRGLLELSIGSKVVLTAYKPTINKMLTGINLIPALKNEDETVELLIQNFESHLWPREGVLVNQGCPLPVPLADGSVALVIVELEPRELVCWPLTQPELQVTPVTVATETKADLSLLSDFDKEEEFVQQNTSVFQQLVEEGVTALQFGLHLTEADDQNTILDNILITGKRGSGKSRLVEAIYTSVREPPHHVHVSLINCRTLKGKKPESVGKIVGEHLEDCVYHQPAVLVLDDLPCIAGAPTNQLEPSQETAYFLRLATVLKELLHRLRVSQCVSVIATAESREQVHPQLLAARGRHSFTTLLHIPTLNKLDRKEILTDLLSTKLDSDRCPDMEELVQRSEGCVAQDLDRIVNRIIFSACQRQTQTATDSDDLQVSAVDLEAALSGFVPRELVNVSLTRNSPQTFASVGGLAQAKQLLTEVLIWPTKYPEVFSNCPLRLERGVLLYGAPGTGKTLLASAIAGESGLNFITVKGPELLSKYIGASEEAVRNVFQKAQSAQPCILFFDEFDSLAPRRGHDSTGVTDRVVNQLLTQLDGVEALLGVWVLAAASRPDLLDPALLRPGRIGTLIHCSLPNQEERIAILQCLSRKLLLDDSVDLTVVADRTDGYSGADLQAVLFTAQMTAYDNIHQGSEDDFETDMTPVENVRVSQTDLLTALRDTMPSLKPEDRFRFQKIYERFHDSKGSSQGPGPPGETNQRVTLA